MSRLDRCTMLVITVPLIPFAFLAFAAGVGVELLCKSFKIGRNTTGRYFG